MIKVKSFKKLSRNSKKYEITFEKNGKMYTRKFGAAGMSDYTLHKDKERRERYISRHKKDLRTNDPMKPGYLSMYILWNKPSVKASLADYKRRLNIYNKTGKFPKDIAGSKKLSFGTVKDMKNYRDIANFLRDKTGRDPSIDFIEPQLKRNLKNYSASKISAAQRGKTARRNLPTKKNLKKILWNLNAEYENPAYADEQMKGGTPWTVLNPGRKETANWLYIAANTLTEKDFDDELWYNTLEHILSEFIDMDPDRVNYDPEVTRNLTVSTDSVEVLMKNIGYYLDFDTLRWYTRAHTWLTEDWATGNAFGKKYKVPDNVVNKKLYESIKSKIKRSIKDRRWGAYDSGRLVREYKAAGGKYKGSKGETNLSRWYKEKWVDACVWPKRKPCGRKTKETIAYCRPSKRVDSKTPKLVQKLTAAQRKSRCARKKKTPMKRVTKFGVEIPTPDIEIGDGWVIHCTHVPGVGNHATLRRKADDWYPSPARDHAFRYGIKNRGGAPEFWARGPIAERNGGLPNTYFQKKLMDHYYNYCGGYNTRELPPPSPAPGPSVYLNSFGNKKKDRERFDKMRQQMYNEIFKPGNLTQNVMYTIKKRCGLAFDTLDCQYKFTGLILSIYYTIMIKTKSPPSKEINAMNMRSDIHGKFPNVPKDMTFTFLNIKKQDYTRILEFLEQLQDHAYGGTFHNANMAYFIHRYINTYT